MANVGVFGSSFDPPSNGHGITAWEAKQFKNLDKVIILPSSQKRGDKTPHVSDEHRLNMVNLAFGNNEFFEVDTYEMEKEAWNCYTYHTMKHFKEKFAGDNVYFIMGADLLTDIMHPDLTKRWKYGSELIAENKFIVVQRDDINMANAIMKNKDLRRHVHNFELMIKGVDNNVSSSFIREELEDGRDPKYYMPEAVYDYVQKNKLYR
jgi:nicotinate-nucleotide adenylyltransferase